MITNNDNEILRNYRSINRELREIVICFQKSKTKHEAEKNGNNEKSLCNNNRKWKRVKQKYGKLKNSHEWYQIPLSYFKKFFVINKIWALIKKSFQKNNNNNTERLFGILKKQKPHTHTCDSIIFRWKTFKNTLWYEKFVWLEKRIYYYCWF